MKTGLCTIAFQDRSFEDVLDLAVSTGFDGVEPWGKHDHLPPDTSDEDVKLAASAIHSRGLEVSQFGSYANPNSDDFEVQMEAALRIAKGLATNDIRVWVGNNGSKEASQEEWDTAICGFRTFCDKASDLGMTLVLEMHNKRLSDTAEGCFRLLEGIDCQNFKLNFQPIYTDTIEEMMATARAVAPHVATVHAQNYVVKGKNSRSLVSEGVVDYGQIISMFRKEGFDGYLEVEFVREQEPEASLIADAAYLRSLCDG